MKLFVGLMTGFGAGLIAAGIAAIASPFREAVHNIGIIGLGTGLFVGGIVASFALRNRRES